MALKRFLQFWIPRISKTKNLKILDPRNFGKIAKLAPQQSPQSGSVNTNDKDRLGGKIYYNS